MKNMNSDSTGIALYYHTTNAKLAASRLAAAATSLTVARRASVPTLIPLIAVLVPLAADPRAGAVLLARQPAPLPGALVDRVLLAARLPAVARLVACATHSPAPALLGVKDFVAGADRVDGLAACWVTGAVTNLRGVSALGDLHDAEVAALGLELGANDGVATVTVE